MTTSTLAVVTLATDLMAHDGHLQELVRMLLRGRLTFSWCVTLASEVLPGMSAYPSFEAERLGDGARGTTMVFVSACFSRGSVIVPASPCAHTGGQEVDGSCRIGKGVV